jgi:hypothetical protein
MNFDGALLLILRNPKRRWNCRMSALGQKGDICAANRHVRFTPDCDQKSGPTQKVMSALPLKADMCSATTDVG